MIQFFAPDIVETHRLPESDSQHAVRVLRMTPGDELTVTDGRGNRHRCVLLDAHPKHAAVEIVATESVECYWTGAITVAVAPTKHMDRMEWMTEKLTEIGVNRIVPLLCRHSERKEIKTDRLVKTAVSAMKQSLKATLPEVDDLTPIKKFIDTDKSELRFVAYCSDEVQRRLLSHMYSAGKSVTILIGPEGDFSPEEIRYALDVGYQPVSLGDARLRTETAAVAACQIIHTINQLNQ